MEIIIMLSVLILFWIGGIVISSETEKYGKAIMFTLVIVLTAVAAAVIAVEVLPGIILTNH